MVDVAELPERIVVPNIAFKRNALAVALNRPAPPVDVDVRVQILDAIHLEEIANVTYGYATPAGERMPDLVRSTLLGPLQSGFTDPLEARIETPGYHGALDIEAHVETEGADVDLDFGFDPIPAKVHVIEDPRDDGMDVFYDHVSPEPDVALDAAIELTSKPSGEKRRVTAQVERVPAELSLKQTDRDGITTIDYAARRPEGGKPDIEATYRETLGDGTTKLDATVRAAGLPEGLHGVITTVPGEEPESRDVDKVDFEVLGGEEISALDFLARNWSGDPGPIPQPWLGPDQFVAVHQRVLGNGEGRFRAAGRIRGVRSVHFTRTGDDRKGMDVRADLGDGVRPLRAILDLDPRGPGAAPDGQRLKLDTTITPLPRNIHATFDPSRGSDPMRLHYETGQTVDVDASVLTAKPGGVDCGDARVTCADVRIDKLPPELSMEVPGDGGTDYEVSYEPGSAGQRPDIRAIVDTTPEDVAKRVWADITLKRIPPQLRGRVDSRSGMLTTAEFHPCDWSYDDEACQGNTADALGEVRFKVRDNPVRHSSLPARPDTAPTFVTMLGRDDHYEVAGRVREVRNVVFRQRDLDADGQADGTLGVRLDLGLGGPFDAKIDTIGPDANPVYENTVPKPDAESKIDVHIKDLPEQIEACIRKPQEVPTPALLPVDSVLQRCDRTNVLGRPGGTLPTTPLSVEYRANKKVDVEATVFSAAREPEDGDRVHESSIHAHVQEVNRRLRIDAIPPVTPDPDNDVAGRKLEFAYDADDFDATTKDKIDLIDFDMEARRRGSVCADPRQGRQALCLSANLHDLPKSVTGTYDPDDSSGDIDIKTAPPEPLDPRLSISPLKLSSVSPADDAARLVLTAHILGITPHLAGKVQRVPDQDGDGEPDLGAIRFDACPDGDCAGIGTIVFNATNSLVGDLLPKVPPLQPAEPGVENRLAYVQRGDDFRVTGKIEGLKRVGLRGTDDEDDPIETTRVETAFGDGGTNEKLRATIDTDDGIKQSLLDALVKELPATLDICFRPPVDEPDEESDIWCEKAGAGKTAIATQLQEPDGGGLPDIDVRRLRIANSGSRDVLEGTATLTNLAKRLEITTATKGDPEILLEGREQEDGPLVDAVGQVDFDLRRSLLGGVPTEGFPWAPLDAGIEEPDEDPRNDGNFIKVHQDGRRMHLAGSIPNIRRLSLHPGACDPDDGRYPDPELVPEPKRADLKCVEAGLAPGQPLGVSVRTRSKQPAVGDDPPKVDVLALDDLHLSELPNGSDGLRATIGKSPDAAAFDPVCQDNDNSGDPDVAECRPPLLSLRSALLDGQDPELSGVLVAGEESLITRLRDKAVPRDGISQRIPGGYDLLPRDPTFPRGARIKIGSDAEATALRAGLKLRVPKFLDVDQPTAFTCEQNQPGSTNAGNCHSEGVSSASNSGVASKDIAIKLVSANDAPLQGYNDGYLGRVALLTHDFDTGGQVIVTGAPPANGPSGTVTTNPENKPLPGDHDLGAEIPAHLDAQIFMRNDYRATDDTKQTSFVQVDGRWNAPLSMSLHLNDAITGRTRAWNPTAPVDPQTIVPTTSLSLRNAAGLGDGVDDFRKPTFRTRAEIRAPKADNSEPGEGECKGEGFGYSAREAGFGFDACLIVPVTAQMKWMQVDLNADPDGAGGDPPARTIDAVVDPEGAKNNADMRAFAEVRDGDADKGPEAIFSPQAQLRLAPMDFGFKLGAGIGLFGGSVDLRERGDLVLDAQGPGTRRLRVSQSLGAVRLGTLGNDVHLYTDFQARILFKVTVEALFGLIEEEIVDIDESIGQHDLEFKDCPGPINSVGTNHFYADEPDDSGAMSFGLPGELSGEALLATAFTTLSKIAEPVWCIVAAADTDNDELVTDGQAAGGHPSPSYVQDLRPVPDLQGSQAAANTSAPLPDTTIVPEDLVIEDGEVVTRCGGIKYDHVHVKAGGVLRAGTKGSTIQFTSGGATNTVECDGTLVINARKVTVDPASGGSSAGRITASFAVPAEGAGTPGSGLGGGAGAYTPGGPSGGGSGGGGPMDNDDPLSFELKPGSRGRGGAPASVGGGAGGGVIRILAKEQINATGGTIAARGAQGGDSVSGVCSAVGGGGGSGGAIELRAGKIFAPGALVTAAGGDGGPGGHGGGGGAGGRVALYSVQRLTAGATVTAGGGGGGPLGGSCEAGGPGGGGNASHGKTYPVLSGLERANADAPTFTSNPLEPLRLRWLLNDEDVAPFGLRGIVCYKRLTPNGDPGTVLSEELDPPDDANTAKELIDTATHCSSYELDPEEESAEVLANLAPLESGFYGAYAFLGAPFGLIVGADHQCLEPTGEQLHDCIYQPLLPREAQVRFAVDTENPTVTITPLEGAPDCPPGSDLTCVQDQSARVNIGIYDGVSGAEKVVCRVDAFDVTAAHIDACGPGEFTLPLHGGNGKKIVQSLAADRVGNTSGTTVHEFLVDGASPQFLDGDRVVLQYPDAEVNGWHRQKPTGTAHAKERVFFQADGIVSGMASNAIGILVDGDEVGTCGPEGSESTCDATSLLPGEGEHEIDATVIDRAGNQVRATNTSVFRVDATAPQSELFVGPETPDGENGWYTTAPFLAFGALDAAGGSGVDAAVPGSGIYYSVDGGPFVKFRRISLGGNRLSDGIHTVCWYAIDVAGNEEMGGAPADENCRTNIKVDTTHPSAADGITPGPPNGANSWYTVTPTLKPEGADVPGDGAGPGEASGIDRLELELDGGGWQPTGVISSVPEGVHETRVRSVDEAGNVSPITERVVRVDLSDPSSRMGTHPPAPNPRGWFRRPVVHGLAASDQRDGSGVDTALFGIDPEPTAAYLEPFTLGQGRQVVRHRAVDRSGRTGRFETALTAIDLTLPAPAPALPVPQTIVLPVNTSTLRFTVTDPVVDPGAPDGVPPSRVKVRIIVRDTLGNVVRELPVPGDADGFRASGSGSIVWNGRNAADKGVLPGLYTYRVQAADAAGNTAVSTESKPFLVVLGVLPL